MKAGEKGVIKEPLIPSYEKFWNFYLGFGYGTLPISGVKEDSSQGFSCCILLDLGLQGKLTDIFAVRGTFTYFIGSSSNSTNSAENVNNEYELTDVSGMAFDLSLPVYLPDQTWPKYYLAPEAGTISSELTLQKLDVKRRVDVTQNSYGIGGGAEWIQNTNESKGIGGYVRISVRKYSDTKEFNGNTGVVINGGFLFAF